jgi:hypothetical protein
MRVDEIDRPARLRRAFEEPPNWGAHFVDR